MTNKKPPMYTVRFKDGSVVNNVVSNSVARALGEARQQLIDEAKIQVSRAKAMLKEAQTVPVDCYFVN
jgi:hypothetical protein